MSIHGCIRCSKCGGACPLCGSCACKHDELHLSYNVVRPVPLDFIVLTVAVGPDKNDEQKPETD